MRQLSRRLQVFCATALLLASFHTLASQSPRKRPPASAPSLNETYDWLKAKLDQIVSDPQIAMRTIHVESAENCKLVFTETWDYVDKKTPRNSYRHFVELGGLDTDHHKIDGYGNTVTDTVSWWQLTVPRRSGASPITTCFTVDERCEQFSARDGEIRLIFSDENVAKRASKALAHAVKLCGGKGDAF